MAYLKGVSKGTHQKGEKEVVVELMDKARPEPNMNKDQFLTFKYFGVMYHCKFQAQHELENAATPTKSAAPAPAPGTVPPTGEPPKGPEQPGKHTPEPKAPTPAPGKKTGDPKKPVAPPAGEEGNLTTTMMLVQPLNDYMPEGTALTFSLA